MFSFKRKSVFFAGAGGSIMLVLALYFVQNNFPETLEKSFRDGNVQVFQYEKYNMTILKTNEKFDFVYLPRSAPSIEAIAQKEDYEYVINGSFYGGTAENPVHAGLLNLFGTEIVPLDPYEPQITAVVRYDTDRNDLTFFPISQFVSQKENPNVLEFQTGPLVILGNKIQEEDISRSLNGMKDYSRTLLAQDTKGTKYFIVVRGRQNLRDIGSFLLSLDIFSETEIDVVNLDGGPSTSLYSKNYPELKFRHTQNLPILFGIKKERD